ncbi:MAG: hypothetical protein GEU73_05000 [Chloroflexi bacterium]|nr:hypothetical protein [Chloroflexota bacterium]
MTTKRAPAAPAKLGSKAKKIWAEITTTYDLRSDEKRVLEDACREVDLVERMEKDLEKGSLIVAGSMGQPVVNELVKEIRQHRKTYQSLMMSLRLPEEDGGAGAAGRSSAARTLAQQRWRKGA